MRFSRSPLFKRHLKKRADKRLRTIFEKRMARFMRDPHDPGLHNHALGGEWAGHRNINITSNYRLVFEHLDHDHYLLVDFGTHDQLYRKRS